jgi:hypothetical protein
VVDKEVTRKQRHRFEIIETIAYWERVLNANILKQFLGLTWNMAIKELAFYREKHPNTFDYNGSLRVFLTKKGFKPTYISTDWELYNDHLIKYSSLYNESIWNQSSVELLSNSLNKVSPDIFHGVSQAIKNRKIIKVKYCSMQNPKGLTRLIHPHAIAFNGRRWHLRAYSETHDEYRDFNLSRLKSVLVDALSSEDPLKDKAWHETKILCLDAHPSLSFDQRKLVLSDYDREEPFKVEIRAAMVKYFVKHHDISISDEDDKNSNPLMLMNAEELKEYLI